MRKKIQLKKLIEIDENLFSHTISFLDEHQQLRQYVFAKEFMYNYIFMYHGDRVIYYDDNKDPSQYVKDLYTKFYLANTDNYLSILKAYTAEYNPLHNYSMNDVVTTEYENYTEAHEPLTDNNGSVIGGKQIQKSGVTHKDITTSDTDITVGERNSDTVKPLNGTDGTTTKTYTTTFDDSAEGRLQNYTVNSGGAENTTGDTFGQTITKNETVSYKNTRDGKMSVYTERNGNIGVTTSQQMLKSEIELRKFDLEIHVADEFLNLYTWYEEGVDYEF